MTRLIDADAVYKWYLEAFKGQIKPNEIRFSINDIRDNLENIPTVDAVPVKHGKWIHRGCGIFACSKCGKGVGLNVYTGEKASETFKWCPNCGADMRGEENDRQR